MRACRLNAARRLGTEHGHSAHSPAYTPKSCSPAVLRRRYWKARDRAEIEGTIFVWNELQRVPAGVYAAAHCPKARIVVSDDGSIRPDPGRGVVRYWSV